MILKSPDVNIADLHPKMAIILPTIDRWWFSNVGYDAIITSACDGKHSATSRHYIGCAVDIRTWTTPTSGKQIAGIRRTNLADDLRDALTEKFGPHFQVLNESTHFHIAFKPTEAVTWAKLV